MKIDEIQIDGFGIFMDKNIDSLSGNLNIIIGNNEAGKSTLLAFLRRILYGFPDGRRKMNQYPPLMGGKHGGYLNIIDQESQEYRIERHVGSPLKLTDSEGGLHGEYELESILGNSPEDVYRNVYAFSLTELQDFETLDNKQVTDRLYSAGAGMGSASLSGIKAEIDKRALEIYREKGSKQELNKFFSDCTEIDQKLNEIKKGLNEYEKIHKELKGLESEMDNLEEEKEDQEEENAERKKIIDAVENWDKINGIEIRLEGLPEIETFPENGLNELGKLDESIDELNEQLINHKAELEKEELTAKKITVEMELIEQKDEIKKLQKGIEKYWTAKKDLPKVLKEKESMLEELRSNLKEIGPEWNGEKLNEFDTSIPTRKTVEKMKDEYLCKKEEQKTAQADFLRAEQANQTKKDELKKLDEENKLLETDEKRESPEKKLRALNYIRNTSRSIREKQIEYKHKQETTALLMTISPQSSVANTKVPTWPGIAVLSVGIVLCIIAIALNALLIGIVSVGILTPLGIVLLIAIRKINGNHLNVKVSEKNSMAPPSIQESSLEPLREDIKRLQSSAGSSLKILNQKSLPDESLLDEMAQTIQSEQRTFLQKEDIGKQRKRILVELRTLDEEKKTLSSQKENLDDKMEQINTKWKKWLSTKGLDEELNYETAIELFQIMRTCREKVRAINSLNGRINKLDPFVSTYESDVELVLRACTRQVKKIDHASEVERLLNDLELALEESESVEKQKTIMGKIEIDIEKLKEKMERKEEKRSELLVAAEVKTSEEFKQRASDWERQEELMTELDFEEKAIKKILGQEYRDRAEEFENLDDIEIKYEELKKSIEEMEIKLEAMIEERGRIRERIEHIEKAEEGSNLMLDKETKLEMMKDLAKEWAVLAIAKQKIQEAVGKYEQERQPGVIKEAEKCFSKITGGRFTHIVKPMDDDKIYALDQNGDRRNLDELSRGTAEQLYLSLRFGFIQEFNKRAAPLPIIIDDTFVNFDPARFKDACDVIKEISETNQVFYFTCHPSNAEVLKEIIPEHSLIEINLPDVGQSHALQ